MRQFRDYRVAWWEVWRFRWVWVCSHGYSHHPWPDCLEAYVRLNRRRWYGPALVWSDKWIEYPLRRLSCRLGHCTAGCRGRTDHMWTKEAGTHRRRSDG